MQAALVVLFFLPLVFSQEFTCDLQYRSRVMRNGVVSGKFDYSWSRGRMKITMPPTASRSVAYTELFQFNSGKGMNGGAAPYLDQWVYRSGSSCACETGHLDSSMPLLTKALLSQYKLYTAGASANGCTTYSRNANAASPNVPTLTVGDTFPCSFSLDDGRSYTLTNCKSNTFTDTSFAPPRDCKCGKPLDIAIVMDRSSSISKTEFLDQKGFVTDFVKQFEYGPFQANLALVHFKSTAWTTLPLVQGNSKANVEASVNELGCPASCDQLNGKCVPNDPTTCCCCCGTSVSSGVRMGADQLKTGRDIKLASKLLIVITDGYHNTLYAKTGFGAECGENSAACTADLKAANDYAFTTLGSRDKVAIYAVGVGADRDISIPELTIVADGHAERVLRRNNFAELASNNLELIARACDENVLPCGGCCGMCICQKCFAPDTCDSPSPCTNASVIGGCCVNTTTKCDSLSDKDPCHTYKCDNDPASVSKGKCIVDAPVACPVSPDPCIKRQCNVTLGGACESIALSLPGCGNQSTPECVESTDCAAVTCSDVVCTPEGKCVWTKQNATGFTGDACFEPKCVPGKGWVNFSKLTCDDGDICFNKTCDPAKGCVSTPINCSDGNACTEDLCDKNRGGCVNVPKVCNTTGNPGDVGKNNGNASNKTNGTACGVAFCEDGVCKVRAVPCAGTNLPSIIAVSAGIGTVALVGIIIAAVILCGGLAGGGVYAAAQGAGGGPMGGLQNNPIYKSDNTGGMNPLYKA